MARGEKEYGAKGMRWVDSKMKDGKGGFVKVRTNKPAEPTVKPKARPAAAPAKAKAKPAPAKPKMTATAKATGGVGAGAKAKAGSARSGAARSTAGKVQEVPGIYRAIVNAFTGKGETDAAKVASKGYRKR